jgi:hypothetical protein
MKAKKENLVRGILLITAFVLGGANAKAEYFRVKCNSGIGSPSIRLGHVNGATEGPDGNYDAMYPPSPVTPRIDFYFQNPYGWFMIDARGPHSTTDFYARIEGVSIPGSVNANLIFSIYNDGQGNFAWKNLIVELYNNGDIQDSNNLIAVHDGYDLVAGSVIFSELNVSNGLSYQLLINPRNYADLDLNGIVNWKDLSKFSLYWKTGDHDANDVWADYGDIDRNGIVDYNDLDIFSRMWLWDANDPNTWRFKARNPLPSDGAMDVSVSAYLSWTAGFGAKSHDVYFGTANPPPFVINQNNTTFEPGPLSLDTTYYWRIDEVNPYGTTIGPVWSFTTRARPGQADNPSPHDGATGVPLNIQLEWTAGSDAESHDIYFGTTNPPPFRRNQTVTTFNPGLLTSDTTYFWLINELNASSTTIGELWSFTTTTDTTSIVAWGRNDYGQCDVPSPNSAIAAGWFHSLGLKQNGSIVAWGYNGDGQCNIPSPNSGFIAISAGRYHSLGLKQDGSIVAWGDNYFGQCNIPSPNSGFIAISAGYGHSLGLKQDGSIVAWGNNWDGQCNIPSPNSGFIAIAAGAFHSLGLKQDGSIVAWGRNVEGQCNIPSPNSGFIAISAGYEHSLGLKQDRSIVAWGYNGYGQCNIPSPNSGFIAISAGVAHSLGLKQDGSIIAWGDNQFGQCNIPSPNSGFIAISAGYYHSLAIKK